MDNTGYAYLKADQHAIYRKAPELRKGQAVKFSTDRRTRSFELLQGVPVVWAPAPRIMAVRDRHDTLHAALTLIAGQKVVTFEKKLIKDLWRMGASLTIESVMTHEIAINLVFQKTRKPLGWPGLFEIRKIGGFE